MQPDTANLNPGVPQPVTPPTGVPPAPPVDPGAVYGGRNPKKKLQLLLVL
ncbi:MAG TPA: hypothetical protein PLD54_00970 [Candidatus Levybacteria bacterium]|nr:hypothetical protein [Candidatus Levybacteria bacterium]